MPFGGGFQRNPQVIKGAKRKQKGNGKETFPRCFVEHKGELLKIEVGPSRKAGVDHWVTVSNLGSSQQQRGGFGNGGGRRNSL